MDTINVTGIGRVTVQPDLADLRLGVTLSAKTVAAVRSANATAMAAVLARLKSIGIDAADLQTSNFNLSPAYDYSRDASPPRLIGYTLANTVAVTIRDLATLGPAIDGALEAGATSLDSIAFRVADQATPERAARAAAVVDARAKADTLAAAAGVSITGVASITEGTAPTPFAAFKGEIALAARDASTPVEVGTSDVTVSVSVAYRIE